MKKIFFMLVMLLAAENIFADDSESFRKKQTGFIKDLHARGRYFDCIAETRRLQLIDEDPMLEYFVYGNSFLAGQYSTVLGSFSADMTSDKTIYPSLFLISQSCLKSGLYSESYQILRISEYGSIPPEYRYSMFLMRIEPLLLSGEIDSIDEEISGAELFLKDEYNFVKLKEELMSYKNDGMKSPALAAAMSAVVPGLGQAYAGYTAEGIISLLSVASATAGGFYLREKGRKDLSYTLFFFSALFYGGNIYGAYNSADACNRQRGRERYQSVTSRYGYYNPDDYIDMERLFN